MIKSTASVIGLILLLSTISIGQQTIDWLTLGHISHQQGDVVSALNHYTTYINLNPEDPIGYVYRARLYEATRRTADSRLDLRIAERLNPYSLMYIDPAMRSKYAATKSYEFDYEDLGSAFIKSPAKYRDYINIIEQLEMVHSQDSLISEIILLLNDLRVNEAEILIDDIEVNDKNRALVSDLKGKVALKRGNYVRAKDLFTESLSYDPSFSIAYHNRSICHRLLGDLEMAEQDLRTAISLSSDISLFYFTFAKLNEQNGDHTAALSNYITALELDAEYEEALINYSQLLKGLGQYEEGIKFLNQAIKQGEDRIENTFLRANLHFVYGNYEMAIKDYDEYLNVYPNDADALYNLGLSKILVRRPIDGCVDLERSLQIVNDEERDRLHFLFCTRGD